MSPTRPTPFRRGSPPSIPGGDRQFLVEELRRLELTLRDLCDLVPQETNTPPTRPRSGMIRRALAPWRPVVGQTEDAWVSFDGASWTYL